MNELTIQENGLSLEDISTQLGAASTNKSDAVIPGLGINYDSENGPMGCFYLKYGKSGNSQNNVYATADGVKFRAFSNHIQYQHWSENNELVNKSLLVKNQREEARDQLGGFECGIPSYEESIAMSKEEKEKYKHISKYRVVRGLVSFTGKTPDGREVIVENQPCVYSNRRKNYGPFYHDVIKKMPEGMNLWDFESILSKDTIVNSYGKKNYIMHFAPQFGSPIPMDQLTYDSLAYVSNLIKDENKRIDEMHKAALNQSNENVRDEKIMDTLEADFS